ncbi:MAG: fibronectin type III domain-containing protein, partial [Clostridiales bacterium]|nr:fibronectin type III domain-containing protein [Candidatus Blautia equi]
MVRVQRDKRKVSSLFLTFLFGMLLLASVVFLRTAEVSAAAMPANIPARVEVTSIKMTSPGRIVLKWKPAENATHYRIYRKDNGKWTGIVTIPATTQYVHDSGAQFPVTYGQKYIYTVRAYNSKSRVWSSYDPAGYTVYTNPDTPKLKDISANGKAVTISWEKAVGATNYYVYYKTETGNWIKCGKTDPNVLTYTHKNSTKYPLESGEKYYYTVRAYNAYLNGYSWIRYTSPGVKMPLAAPKLSGVRMIGESVLFSWEEIKGASNYFVYSKLPGGNWKRIATLDGADNSCFIHKKSSSFPMIPGDTYIYTVRGYDEETGVSGPYDKNGITYKIPVKQTVPTA